MNQRVAIILIFFLGIFSTNNLMGQICPPVNAYDQDESPIVFSPDWLDDNDSVNTIVVSCMSLIDDSLFMRVDMEDFFGIDVDSGGFSNDPVNMCYKLVTPIACLSSTPDFFEVEVFAYDNDGFRHDPTDMFDVFFTLNDAVAPTFDPIPAVTISTLPPTDHACPSSSGATAIDDLMVGGGPYAPGHEFTVGGTTVAGPSLFDDNCSSSVDLDVNAISFMMMPNSCDELVMIEWGVTDRCGNTATSIQNITVSDETPPVWDNNPTDVTILNSTGCADCPSTFTSIPEFDALPSFPAAFGFNSDLTIACQTLKSPLASDVSDVCNSVSLEVVNVAYAGNASSRTATVIWSAVDACGNRTNRVQVFRLTDDVAPVINSGTSPLNFNCSGTIPTPTVTENCQTIPTAIINTAPDPNVAGIYYSDDVTHSMMCDYVSTVERTWQASDGAGNLSNTWVQTINFNDETAPTFDLPTNVTVNNGLQCSDDPLGNFFPTYLESQVAGSGFPTNIADSCQPNEATSTSNYNGTNMWTTDGDYSVKFTDNIDCPHPDGCTPAANGNLPKFRINRTWEITDDCGNTSTQTQFIDVSDNTPPTISGDTNLGTLNLSAANGACPNDADFLLFSNTSSASTFYYNGTNLIVRDPETNAILKTFTASTTEKVPVATDECGNMPFLMCNNTATLNIENVVVINNTNAPCLVTYRIIWNATDHCGNTNSGADRHFQSITFRDNSAPAWNFTAGDLDENIDCNDSTAPSGGDVSVPVMTDILDNCGVVISYTQVNNIPTATSASGLYYIDAFAGSCTTGNQTLTRTWYAVDACGNVSPAFIQNINIEDTTGPTFTSLPPDDATLKCIPDSSYYLYLLAAIDDCSTTPVDLVSVVDVNITPLATGCATDPITIERTYTVEDVCGNTSSHTQTLVISDDVAPIITTQPADITVCPDHVPSPDITLVSAIDQAGCSSMVNITFVSDSKSSTATGCVDLPRTTTRTYHATDMCGNITTVTQTITEDDNQRPTRIKGPSDLTVECDTTNDLNETQLINWLATGGGAEVIDNCSTPKFLFDLNVTSGSKSMVKCQRCFGYNFWAVDKCSPTDSLYVGSASFCLEDNTAPVFDALALDTTVQCNGSGNLSDLTSWLENNGGASATETCSAVIWSYKPVDTLENCGLTRTLTYEFTAEDSCGNKILTTADFNIIDTDAPEWMTPPVDAMVECDGNGNLSELNAWLTLWSSTSGISDDCGLDSVRYQLVSTFAPDTCMGQVRYVYDFIAVDFCGNSSVERAAFQILDTSMPTFTCPKDTTIYCTDSPSFSFTGIPSVTDVCTGTITPTFIDNVGAPGCNQTIIRTWTAEDDCGNSFTCDQTIMVSDTLLPVALNKAEDLTVECDGSGNVDDLNAWLTDNAGAVATDDCGSLEYVKHEITPFPAGNFQCKKCVEYAFWAKDGCNADSISLDTVKFCIEDRLAPTFKVLALDTTVQCDGSGNISDLTTWLGNNGGASAIDSCSAIVWSYQVINTQENCGLTRTVTYEFTAEDSCGNKILTTADFNIIDTDAPEWMTPPVDAMVECDGNGNLSELNAWLTLWSSTSNVSDDCGLGSVRYQLVSTFDPDTCMGQVRYVYDFIAVDFCGNSSVERAAFQILDTSVPTFTCPKDTTIYCTDSPSFSFTGIPSVTDICTGTITPTFIDNVGAPGCTQTIVRTWTAEDDCRNSFTCEQTIMVSDTLLPIALNKAEDLTVECDGSGNVDDLNAWLADNAGAVATDDCGSIEYVNHEITPFPTGNFECKKCVEYAFWAKDGCNADSISLDTVKFCIEDTRLPTFDTLAIDMVVDCNAPGNALALTDWLADNGGARASDSCSAIVWSHELVNTQSTCGGSIETYQFTAKDACGFEIVTSARFIIEDDLAPEWLVDPRDTIVYCDGTNHQTALDAWLAEWSDESNVNELCGGDTIIYSLVRTINPDPCFGQQRSEYRFVAEDDCGNKSIKAATFFVRDTLPPTISCPDSMVVDCKENYSPSVTGTAIGSDACSFSNSASFKDSVVSNSCPVVETVYRTWAVSDACGNTSSCVQVIERVDTEPPFISNSPQTIFQVELTDAFGGCHKNIRYNRLNMTTQNCWEVLFDINDMAGNNLGQVSFPGPCVVDDCSDLDPTSTIVPRVANKCKTEFDVNWVFKDNCNDSTTLTQTITFFDRSAPQWTSPNPLIVDGKCSDDINQLIADNIPTIKDNCRGIIKEVSRDTISSNCSEIRIIEYETMDSCGNVNPIKLQVRVEISDDLAPVWDIAPRDITFECDGSGNNSDLAAWLNSSSAISNVSDDCGTPNVSYSIRTTNNPPACGQAEYVYQFVASDGCGNSTSTTAKFSILDTTAPMLSCPPTANIDCGESAFPFFTGTAIANDVCSFVGFPVFMDTAVPGNCPGPIEVITRTWTATDGCGQTGTCSQTINVRDTEKPEIYNGADDEFISLTDLNGACTGLSTGTGDPGLHVSFTGADGTQCSRITIDGFDQSGSLFRTWNFDGPCAVDDCAGIDFSAMVTPNHSGCTTTFQVAWTVKDACGNVEMDNQTITFSDGVTPTWLGSPNTVINSGCEADVNDIIANNQPAAFDNCQLNYNVVSDVTTNQGACAGIYTRTITYSISDDCGNVNPINGSLTINMNDSSGPVFTTAPSDATFECNGSNQNLRLQDWLDNDAGAVVMDNCGTATLSSQFIRVLRPCPGTFTREYWFIAEDDCGNRDSMMASFKTIDTTPPNINTSQLANATVACDGIGNVSALNTWLSDNAGANATDACSAVRWRNRLESSVSNSCSETTDTYQFIAEDRCGNADTISASFTVLDVSAPIFINTPPTSVTVNCNAQAPAPWTAQVTDCDPNVSVVYNQVVAAVNAGGIVETITRTWTATDCKNMSSSFTQIITVRTGVAPGVLFCPGDIGPLTSQNGGCVVANWTPPSFSGVNVSVSSTHNPGDCFPVGTTTVTYTATDNCGGGMITCSFDVEINQACQPTTPPVTHNFIQQVSLNSINNVSGNDNGYGNYKSQSTTLYTGNPYYLTLNPGGPGGTGINAAGFWRVWMDWNGDGLFNEPSERVAQAAGQGLMIVQINIPNTAILGTKCIRVAFGHFNYPQPCDQFANGYGEMEDYTVHIIPQPNLVAPDNEEEVAVKEVDKTNVYQQGFIAELQREQVDLSWIALDNSAIEYFEIEKSSNGYDFSKLLKINGLSDSDGALYYKAKDRNPFVGNNYYRLIQHLKNGEVLTSEIQKVVYLPIEFSLDVYPNPTDGKLFVRTINGKDHNAEIRILNNLSQLVREFKFDRVEPLIELDVMNLPNGVYYLIFQSGETTKVEQIIIQR